MNVVVIGAGIGGISAAAYLAYYGHTVTVLEKNNWVGGRIRSLNIQGYRFDMGPSWYLMPAEHDKWFADLGENRHKYYKIHRVDPSYRIYWGSSSEKHAQNSNMIFTVPANIQETCVLFEKYEQGAGKMLLKHLEDCKKKYEAAMQSFIYKNYSGIFSFLTFDTLKNLPLLNILQSYHGRIKKRFHHPFLQHILEYPAVFLGSNPKRTPAVYTLMNYIDFVLGTWYPYGGFSVVTDSMWQVASKYGARIRLRCAVKKLQVNGSKVEAAVLHNGETIPCDAVVANADYHHVETALLPSHAQSIAAKRWKRCALAPSVITYYFGFDIPIPELAHHTFFFDADWNTHLQAIYEQPEWVKTPLFYLHLPKRSDKEAGPEGHEVIMVLIPVAAGLPNDEVYRRRYKEQVLDRIEACCKRMLRKHLVFQHCMSLQDFQEDYHAYKGNAFGFGHTFLQTAALRLPNISRKVKNLYYAGQYTVPGTGTTMSAISGRLAAERIIGKQ